MWLSLETALLLAVAEQGRGGNQLDEPPQTQQKSVLSLQSGMKDLCPSFLRLVSLQVATFHGLGCLNTLGANLTNEVLSSAQFLNSFLYPALWAVQGGFQPPRWSFVIQSPKPAVAFG